MNTPEPEWCLLKAIRLKRVSKNSVHRFVIPGSPAAAQAGIQGALERWHWIPACAGMTEKAFCDTF